MLDGLPLKTVTGSCSGQASNEVAGVTPIPHRESV
jgi:hypothetical protein